MFKASALLVERNASINHMIGFLRTNAQYLPTKGLHIYDIKRPHYNGKARLLPSGEIECSDDYTRSTGTMPISEFAVMFGSDALSCAVEAVGDYIE